MLFCAKTSLWKERKITPEEEVSGPMRTSGRKQKNSQTGSANPGKTTIVARTSCVDRL